MVEIDFAKFDDVITSDTNFSGDVDEFDFDALGLKGEEEIDEKGVEESSTDKKDEEVTEEETVVEEETTPPTEDDKEPIEEPTEDIDTEAENKEDIDLDLLLKEVQEANDEAQDKSDEIKEDIASGKEQVSEELQVKLDEQARLIEDISLKYDTLLERYKDAVSKNEDMELESISSNRMITAIQDDPEMQEYFAIKRRAATGNEVAQQQLEQFYKDALAQLGYDIPNIVKQQKEGIKSAMSEADSAPLGVDMPEFDEEKDEILDDQRFNIPL